MCFADIKINFYKNKYYFKILLYKKHFISQQLLHFQIYS